MEDILNLVKKIKNKKELSGISEKVIRESLENYISKYHIKVSSLNERELKFIIKEIRSQLRLISGRYQIGIKDKFKLLEKNQVSQLLKTHSSTAERFEYYPMLREKIKELKVKSILDLGCGLNPLALASPELKYFASDIKEDELNLIEIFFKINKIKGKTFLCDLKNLSTTLPKTDLALLFKVLDIIEGKHHKLSEKIISLLDSRYILASFATRTISGKLMKYPDRIWFEKILIKLKLNFKRFSIPNEIFYLITKEI